MEITKRCWVPLSRGANPMESKGEFSENRVHECLKETIVSNGRPQKAHYVWFNDINKFIFANRVDNVS
jgi:hypothetical protein